MNFNTDILYKYALITLKSKARNKIILFWGDNEILRNICHINGFETLLVTYIPERVSNDTSFIEDFAFKSDKYFILIPWLTLNSRRQNILRKLGYDENHCCFLLHEPIHLTTSVALDYYDDFENHITSSSEGIQIILKKGVTFCNIKIGHNIKGSATIVVTNSCVDVIIGDNCQFKNQFFYCNAGSILTIGKNCTFNSDTNISVTNGNSVRIGDDCMFSFGIQIHCGDAHSIFDLKSRKRLNPLGTQKIEIGNHVWCGYRVNMLAPFKIGNDSIIGAASLAKGIYNENNIIIAGVPSRKIRNDVVWERDNTIEEIYPL